MKKQARIFLEKVKNKAIKHPNRTIAFVGFATFFFGFGAAALLNFYLLYTHSTFIVHLRGSLDYKSAIFGDGILLPIVNMLVASFLLKNSRSISKQIMQSALLCGLAITAYFHVTQAMQGLINWAMPTPWHWNVLGLWHACYMFSVCSLLSLFYLLIIKLSIKEKHLPKNALVVSAGIALFFFLLRIDYSNVNLQNAFASDVTRTRNELTGVVQNGKTQLINLTPLQKISN